VRLRRIELRSDGTVRSSTDMQSTRYDIAKTTIGRYFTNTGARAIEFTPTDPTDGTIIRWERIDTEVPQ
jgi:hypothetical protein